MEEDDSNRKLGLKHEKHFYSSGLVKDNQVKQQYLLIYKPTKKCFKQKLPLLILIHGGGFDSGDPYKVEDIGKYYIDRGFLVVSIGYRLVPDKSVVPKKWAEMSDKLHKQAPPGEEIRLSEFITAGVSKTAYAAVRDIKAAIRWLTKHKDTYNIDEKNVFMWGESAGALIALTAHLAPKNSFFKDDDEIILKDTTLNTSNDTIKPFKIKSSMVLSTSDQILQRLSTTYVPDLWKNKKTYKNVMLIHGNRDILILEKFPRRLYERYNMHKMNDMIKYLNVPNEGHVPFKAVVNGMTLNEHMLDHMIKLIGIENIVCDDLKQIYNKKNTTIYKPPVLSKCPVCKECKECEEPSSNHNYIIYAIIAIISLVIGIVIGKFVF